MFLFLSLVHQPNNNYRSVESHDIIYSIMIRDIKMISFSLRRKWGSKIKGVSPLPRNMKKTQADITYIIYNVLYYIYNI